MAFYVSTNEDILDLFSDLVDGDEFQSEDAALRSMNSKYFTLLSERDWYFLDKSVVFALTNLLLSQITDLDKVLRIWYVSTNGVVSQEPLREAPYSDRFNTDYDYYIDQSTQSIVLINTIANGTLRVDYKYRPNPLALEVTTGHDLTCVIPITFRPLLALAMVHDFKKADEAIEMFKEHGYDEDALHNAMIDDDSNHKQFYAQ